MDKRYKINKVRVPSFVTKTTYDCDCGHSSESEHEAQRHYALEHATAELIHAGGATFRRFDSEENFKAWAHEWYYRRLGEWVGPGWYYEDTHTDYDGDEITTCHPIAGYLKTIEEKKKEIAEVEEFVKNHIDTKA